MFAADTPHRRASRAPSSLAPGPHNHRVAGGLASQAALKKANRRRHHTILGERPRTRLRTTNGVSERMLDTYAVARSLTDAETSRQPRTDAITNAVRLAAEHGDHNVDLDEMRRSEVSARCAEPVSSAADSRAALPCRGSAGRGAPPASHSRQASEGGGPSKGGFWSPAPEACGSHRA